MNDSRNRELAERSRELLAELMKKFPDSQLIREVVVFSESVLEGIEKDKIDKEGGHYTIMTLVMVAAVGEVKPEMSKYIVDVAKVACETIMPFGGFDEL